jgi:hypothetical protein
MNWTGLGVAFPRAKWPEVKQRDELSRPGVCILVGFTEDDDLPTLYIGQGEEVRSRIDSHYQNKDFWDRGIVFISTSGWLKRAHITWLEYELIARAERAKRCHLGNAETGRVLDEDGRAIPHTIFEIWQANAAGRQKTPQASHLDCAARRFCQ